ncbi:MAG: D-glycero-beta-D-manno-heptose-7-phosphate kinase, partial [Ignavibacteriales bacterium]|nr:D-glycero-beta-D-manno-heptose-7-phosphate kinase [Ignavibacteriales bacterium]
TIAVIGDLMLDRYIWGNVTRISPEAPVPVVDVESESARLGGAANVANNIKSLGGNPFLVGVIGDDNSGKILRDTIKNFGFSTDGLVKDESRPTTVKTRVIAHEQHVVRIDRESRQNISGVVEEKILFVLRRHIKSIDAIVLEDYNKGVMTESLIEKVVSLANTHKKIVTVDPKSKNFFSYNNITVFKPNRKETEEALQLKLTTEKETEIAGKMLLQRLHADHILLTRSEKGMSLFSKDGAIEHIPTKARKVADVSGAGDTVISTLTLALASGATIQESAIIANFAGGIVVGEVGVVPISKEALRQELLNELSHQS